MASLPSLYSSSLFVVREQKWEFVDVLECGVLVCDKERALEYDKYDIMMNVPTYVNKYS